MILLIALSFLLDALFTVLQTTLLIHVPFFTIQPDIGFLILVYCAFVYGSMFGQILGFASGVLLDFMTNSPLGFHSLLGTLCGFIIGRFKGMIQLDILFIPMLLTLAAFILRWVLLLISSFLFGMTFIIDQIVSLAQLVELALSLLFCPLIFFLLKAAFGFVQAKLHYRL